MRLTLHRATQRADEVIGFPNGKGFDATLLSHWAKYSCVLSAGYIEESIRTIITDHIRSNANHSIQNYVFSQVKDFTNAKPEKIARLLNSFNEDWYRKFCDHDRSEKIRVSVGSIIANRHLIAHGRDTSITHGKISEWHNEAKKMIGFFDDIVPGK